MQKEYADCETKMKRLRDTHLLYTEQLGSVRNTVVNPRGLYQEMDATANKLKEFDISPWGFSNVYGLGLQVQLAKRSALRFESAIDQEIEIPVDLIADELCAQFQIADYGAERQVDHGADHEAVADIELPACATGHRCRKYADHHND